MIDREMTCKACEGTGLLADDEGWQYGCSICEGNGYLGRRTGSDGSVPRETDSNNRLLD
ncbi:MULTISPECIES: hypothetical protein [Sporosarcina]|uniref:hypothetical protein n=1 Tax=Sporosarcina TaxID=1569 RepID=UPI000B1D0C5B|nr:MULTISPECIES: hypothetical protein [Sporosarcina]WJY27577.1 hypothetical protein QWT68_00735 [Sporosarcina sp. 0.2-SM1T-5]